MFHVFVVVAVDDVSFFFCIFEGVKSATGRALHGLGGFRPSPNWILSATPILGPWCSPFELDRGPTPCSQDKAAVREEGGQRETEEGETADRREVVHGVRCIEAGETNGHVFLPPQKNKDNT